ncbi:hypothetical protein [Nonomuraea sp. NPDC005650]|uniref:hypothetical protein n=1 Tax=Nonomuraea sp. NPDC005650 TaxID=3157045 RepID=UPI0033BF8FAA
MARTDRYLGRSRLLGDDPGGRRAHWPRGGAGKVKHHDQATSQLLHRHSTDYEPDGVLRARRNKVAQVCRRASSP